MRNFFDLKSSGKNTYFKTYIDISLLFIININNLNSTKYLIFFLLFEYI